MCENAFPNTNSCRLKIVGDNNLLRLWRPLFYNIVQSVLSKGRRNKLLVNKETFLLQVLSLVFTATQVQAQGILGTFLCQVKTNATQAQKRKNFDPCASACAEAVK